jgi:hypothetical protein
MVSDFEGGVVETVGSLPPIHDDPIEIEKPPRITRPRAFQTQPNYVSSDSDIEGDGGKTVGTIPPKPEVARQIAYYEPPEASSSRIRPDRVPSITIGTRTLGERILSTAGDDSDFDSDSNFGL